MKQENPLFWIKLTIMILVLTSNANASEGKNGTFAITIEQEFYANADCATPAKLDGELVEVFIGTNLHFSSDVGGVSCSNSVAHAGGGVTIGGIIDHHSQSIINATISGGSTIGWWGKANARYGIVNEEFTVNLEATGIAPGYYKVSGGYKAELVHEQAIGGWSDVHEGTGEIDGNITGQFMFYLNSTPPVVEGFVLNADDGKPLSGVTIEYNDTTDCEEEDPCTKVYGGQLQTASDGSFGLMTQKHGGSLRLSIKDASGFHGYVGGSSVPNFNRNISLVPQESKSLVNILSVNGDVEVKEVASDEWKSASEGQRLGQGAAIETGGDSEAHIVLGGENIVSLGEDTELSVGEKANIVNLDDGSIGVAVKTGSPFTIKTDEAETTVTGTAFKYTITRSGDTIEMLEGSATVKPNEAPDKQVSVSAGRRVIVDDDETRIEEMNDTDRMMLQQDLSDTMFLAASAKKPSITDKMGSLSGGSGGIMEKIKSFINRILSIFNPSKKGVVCNPPYITVGKKCCLDKNNNRICDKDEAGAARATTVSARPVATTTLSTTSRAAATTITATTQPATTTTFTTSITQVTCSVNSECGAQTEKRVCYQGDLYLQRNSPICKKSGTPESYCIQKTSFVGASMTTQAKPIKICMNGCKDGDCL